MFSAIRGQELDFSVIAPAGDAAVRTIGIDPRKLAQLRKSVSQHVKELGLKVRVCEWDPVIVEAVRIWDDGRHAVQIEGEVSFERQPPPLE
jgi:hypothetical protein